MVADVAIDFLVYEVVVLFELARSAIWLVASIDQACEHTVSDIRFSGVNTQRSVESPY
jgi:hypothetical protein